MKGYIKYILVGIATVLLAIACVEEGQFEKPVFANIKPYFLKVSAENAQDLESSSGNITVKVESIETGWKITGMPDWIQVDPTSGNGTTQVKISYKENTSTTAARSAVLTLASTDSEWNFSTPFTVSQKRSLCYANLSSESITVDGKAGPTKVQVISNTADWQVTALSDLSGWATVSKDAGGSTMTLNMQANVGNVSRSGTIQLSTVDSKVNISLTQRPANITSSFDQVEMGVYGGNKSINVTSDAAWTAQTSSAWIQVTPATGGVGESNIVIEAQPNYTLQERTGYIYLVLSDDSKKEIPVKQECVKLSIDNNAFQFTAKGSEAQLSVTSNVGWKVSEGYPEWLILSPVTAEGSAVMTVTAPENGSTDSRSGSFSVSTLVMDYSKSVDVSQSGYVLQMDSTALKFSVGAGSAHVSIESDGSWTAAASDTWITVTPASGAGDGTLTVSVTENTGVEGRSGYITVTLGSSVYRVPVIQQGKYLELSGDQFNLKSAGGNVQVDIESNDGWTASVPDSIDWVTLSDKSGDGNCNMTITVADNPSILGRTAVITVAPANLSPLTIRIVQAPRYMDVPVGSVSFFAKGGTSDNIKVETDGTLSVVSDADWLTVNTLDNGLFTLTAQENTAWSGRDAKVTISMTGLEFGELQQEIDVHQDEFREALSVSYGGVEFFMIPVRGGTFTMGTDATGDIYTDNERPAHEVTLSDYYIGQTEVTQELWYAVMGHNPSFHSGKANLPIENVTWNACLKFVQRLSELTELKFRLPTEAEWEYAARGGVYATGHLYSGSDKIDDIAWYSSNSVDATHPVGTLAPNELGIYDMNGNVQEWCLDWYSDYTDAAVTNPHGPEDGAYKTNRGGFVTSYAKDCRVTYRGLSAAPSYTNKYMGLRIVLSDLEINTSFSNDILPLPDGNFKAQLVRSGYDLDGDLEISYEEAARITRIEAAGQGISSLSGIESMPKLTYLDVSNNLLTTMNLSQNTELKELYCSFNNLNGLDISNNKKLTKLNCTENSKLYTIYVWEGFNESSYPNFVKESQAFYLENTAQVIDIADASFRAYLLAHFDTDHNGLLTANEAELIKVIDVCTDTIQSVAELSYMTALQSLTLTGSEGGQLTSIDLSANTALTVLNLSGNQLTTTDLSADTLLTTVNLSNNALSGQIDVSMLTGLTRINVSGNTALEKIWVFDGFGTATNGEYMKDTDARFLVKAIDMPDATFRAFILENYDSDGNGALTQLEAEQITSLAVQGRSITSLKGIRYMTALLSLDCSSNSLTELDLTQNSSLTTLNVKGNTNLKRVDVWSSFSKAQYEAVQFDRQTYFVPEGNGRTFKVNGVSFTMITVPGGTFTMGATTEQGTDAAADESPAHEVTLTTFSIGQTEVTQALWKALMGTNPSTVEGDNLPVDMVSWSDCRLFIQRLNTATGLNFRFATEAEWEYAARGGAWSKGYKYSGGDDPDEVAWYKLSRGSHLTHDVATAYPNELGLYDMSGNLLEWCMDWDGEYSAAAQTDPTGASAGEKHAIRGGSWDDDAVYCRVSSRYSAPDRGYSVLGLRLVLGGADIADSWYGQWISIPDESLSAVLLDRFDDDEDGHMSVGELESITTLNLASMGTVANLTGIEYMTNLTQLYCNGNQLTSINVSKNTKLKSLVCASNQLTTLDISKNRELTTLNATGNANLTTIYVWDGFVPSEHSSFRIPDGAKYVVKK